MGRDTSAVSAQADNGFFGPGSVAWRVWAHPTSVVHGFLRAVVIEELDPFLVASVDQTGQVKQRTALRYDRTMQYFATVLFADAKTVLDSAELLVKIHSRATGPEPITGGRYDANDPDSQLWIHVTAWHSILYTYEVYGPGKLTPAEEDEFWRACAVAAEFQTIDPAAVPRNRAQVREYFQRYRAKLVGSEVAQDMMDFLLDATKYVLPKPVPTWLRLVVARAVRCGVIATMPRWMRKLGGTPQSRLVDLAATAVTKPIIAVLARRPELALKVLAMLAPRAIPAAGPVLLAIPPVEDRTWTPADAYHHFDKMTPREQYEKLRASSAPPSPYPVHHHEPVLEFTAD